MENKLIGAAVKDRKVWEALREDIDNHSFSDLAEIVFKELSSYYEKDKEANECDVEIIKKNIKRDYPKHHELLETLLNNIPDCSIPNVADYVHRTKIDRIGLEVAKSLAQDSPSSEKNIALVRRFLEENDKAIAEAGSDIFSFQGAHSIVEKRSQEKPISLWPKTLNNYLESGVTKQHHILVYGRPEIGKSLAAITMATGFARQGLRTIYFCNEDPEIIMRERLLSCITGKTKYEIRSDPEETDRLAKARGFENIGLCYLSPGSIFDIERIVRTYEPIDCIVVDQIRNLHVNKMVDRNRIQQLEQSCQAVRNIAQKHSLVAVSVTQAGDSATNKPVLEMGDVDFSNTGMQAHVDLMIGVGSNESYDKVNIRVLSFPKNKINGQHGTIQVKLNPPINRMQGT